MKYTVNKERFGSSFQVPADIVDKHLRLASGEQIKVLLLILRKMPEALDENKIAAALKYNVADVEDYLQYWVLTGVLKEENAEAAAEPVKYVPKAEKKTAASIPEPVKEEYSRPSASEIAARIGESKEIANLFTELQAKLGKTIGYDGQCTFILLHDRFGLPADVIFMLVDYCVSIGKTGYSYIEAAGRSWGEQEIDTIEKAAEKIASLNKVEKFWKKFAAETGIKNPKPTSKQTGYIEHWLTDLRMKPEMIMSAYEEMADSTGKVSFSYMNKILERWHAEGIKTPSALEESKAARTDAKSAKAPAEASYDLDEYREKTIHSKLKYERKQK